jgi:hypothetical protein
MKKAIATFGILLAGLIAFGQEAQNPNAPQIEFENDYGTVEQGGNGVYEFVFTNTGKEPLIITSAKGSCGCTVPSWPNEPIAPGSSDVIRVKYDTKRLGPFNKSVTIISNASTPTKVIRIKGKIVAPEGGAPKSGGSAAVPGSGK